jgi:hypothetical protein
MPRDVKLASVRLADLPPRERELVSQAAIDELGLARK